MPLRSRAEIGVTNKRTCGDGLDISTVRRTRSFSRKFAPPLPFTRDRKSTTRTARAVKFRGFSFAVAARNVGVTTDGARTGALSGEFVDGRSIGRPNSRRRRCTRIRIKRFGSAYSVSVRPHVETPSFLLTNNTKDNCHARLIVRTSYTGDDARFRGRPT